MKKKFTLLVTVLALILSAPAFAVDEDPGGGSSYPYTTGQCRYANMGTWLDQGSGWGYYCNTDGFVWYWSSSNGWQYLGWD